ncbi:MAG: YceI family protein [Pseudomonadota bacterium]
MKKFLTIVFTLLFSASINAAEVPTWKIITAQSKLNFKVAQGKSDVVGYFKKFDGKINFDKDQLAKSKVVIDIDTSSIVISLAEGQTTVQGSEWLATSAFPKATFSAAKFALLKDKKTYRADGDLTIKGRTFPVSLDFTFDEYSATKARATGKTHIQRSVFTVGNSDIKKANDVSDDVEVTFSIAATK